MRAGPTGNARARIAAVLLLALVGCGAAARPAGASQSAAPDPLREIPRGVDALLAERVRPGEPGVAVLLLRCGSVAYARGAGLADLATRAAITPATGFELASVSKQFTAFVAALLVRERTLQFDVAVARYVPELAGSPAGAPTLAQLATHTAGEPDYLGWIEERGQRDGPWLDNDAVVRMAAAFPSLDFQPGERFEYSNTNYVLLAESEARATGRSFEQLLRNRVFEPMGMTRAAVFDRAGEVIPGRARGYRRAGGSWEVDDYEGPVVGDGGIVLSLEDFVGWERALTTDAILPRDAREPLFTPPPVRSGPRSNYGMGWAVSTRRGRRWLSHDGAYVGFRSYVGLDDARRVTVVVLSNRADIDAENLGLRAHRVFMNAIAGTALDAPCGP